MRNWKTGASTALLLAVTLSGCSDSRLKKFSVGITPDSVTKLMGGDSAHTVTTYLVKGKQWQVKYYTRSAALPTDSVQWRKMSPVIFADGLVVGWGWGSWEKDAKMLAVPVPE